MARAGRPVRENGNRSTDHHMLLLGGGVKGGKIYGKWPGLDSSHLYENRDLAVTTDFRDVFTEAAVIETSEGDQSLISQPRLSQHETVSIPRRRPCVSKSRGRSEFRLEETWQGRCSLLVLTDGKMNRTARKGESTMSMKRAAKPGRKAKDLPVTRLSTKQSEGVKGGKRTVVFIVPPKEIPAK